MHLKNLKEYKLFKNENLLNLQLLKNQGFCNINYLLITSKSKYLIRKFKNDFNIDRRIEFKIQKKAYNKNIASNALHLDEKNQVMICKYLKGKHKYSLKNKEIKLLALNIKKLHSIKTNIKEYDFYTDLKAYRKNILNPKVKESINICKKELKKLKSYKKTLVTTHHDLNPKNILFYKNTIKFIDWEYAGKNDIFFDLATVCFEFLFTKKQEKTLLKSYLKTYTRTDIKKLHLYIRLYKHLCKLWFLSLDN